MSKAALALAAMLVTGVAACSSGSDGAPGSVTADEAAGLNDAAAMLDANSIDANALDATTNEGSPR